MTGQPPNQQHPHREHNRENTLTDPDLSKRGNVFFAAVEMTRMPMILTDPHQPDNPIAFANKAFLDLTGYEEKEVLGRNCRFLQGAQTDRSQVDTLRRAIEKEESVSLEILNYKRDGTPFWNAVFIGPVYNTDNELIYYFASQLDVTRRRTTEQSYRQAQKMEAVGQLTAGLAHDFNNLLHVIIGNLELLSGQNQSEKAQRYIASTKLAAERGAKLTSQLLAFARKTRLEPKPISVTKVVRDFKEIIETTMGRVIDLELDLEDRIAPSLIDQAQLEMALLNILINARDAMPRGGRVTVRTTTIHLRGECATGGLENGDYVCLSVTDEGGGIPPHLIDRVTEPFFTTKETGKGTGLGLAMASGFAQQSGGRLDIESQLGVGTTIRFLFPVAKQGDEAEAAVVAQVAEQAPARGRILVVEDNADVLQLAVDLLSSMGYQPVPAHNGVEAMRIFEADHAQNRFDLVFTDLVMPGPMDGLGVAAAIKLADPTIPILLTTGYNEQLVADAPSRPFMDVIGKPYSRNELADRVRQALRQAANSTRRKPSAFGSAEA